MNKRRFYWEVLMATAHVFIAVSLDGFIADKDVIVMGRGSYEKVRTFDTWFYDRPVVVLSEQLTGTPVPEALKGKLRFSNLAPADLMAELAGQGVQRVYVDGGQLVQSFLRDGLVADMVITTVPVLIGSGRRLFGGLQRDIDWELVSSCSFPSGLVQASYRLTV